MTVEDKVGHVGYSLLFGGCVLLAWECWLGWPLYLLGDLVWLWLGRRMRMSSIVLWQVVFIGTACWGWWNWTH